MIASDTPYSASRNMAIFIDADNLNEPAVLERALQLMRLKADRVLFRRAYGRPDSLKGIESVLSRHAIRPVANLVLDKVTTDCALVIDAVEAVCTNDIQSVVICSGDTDFVPLAIWLREKGCRVTCYSLANKIFANPERFFDEVVLLESSGATQDRASTAIPIPSDVPSREPAIAVRAITRRPDASAEVKVSVTKNEAGSAKPLQKPSVKDILTAVPELRDKTLLSLSQVAKKLRDAELLGKNASSATLLRSYPAQFELTPKTTPNSVKYRG